MCRLTLTIALLAGVASAALAQSAPATPAADAVATKPGRFTFNRVDDGFLRLDNQTGQVAYCTSRGIGWACRMVPEDRAALEQQIARLQNEIAALKAKVATLHEPPSPTPPPKLAPPPPPANAPPPAVDKGEDVPPPHGDLARARTAFESAWQRLVDMIVIFQRDMLGRGS